MVVLSLAEEYGFFQNKSISSGWIERNEILDVVCGIVSTLDNGCCIGELTIISVDDFEAGIIEVGNANGEALGDGDIDS